MGKKTPSASASKSEVTDLPIDAAVGDCPLKRKGDIKVVVQWRHNGAVVRGVPIDLQGPTPGKGTTDGTGAALFKKRVPGAYTYEADFSALNMKYPARLAASANVGASRDKLTTIVIEIEELSALKIDVKEKDGDAVVGPLPDQDVLSISGNGMREDGKAEVLIEQVPAGKVTVDVKVRKPTWALAPDQNMTVTLAAGAQSELTVFARKQTWVAVKVHDLDTKKDLAAARLELTLPDGSPAIEKLVEGKAKTWFPKSDAKAKVAKAVTGSGKDDDAVYEFVEIAVE